MSDTAGSPPPPIVCIGASWGGLAALRIVLAALPASLPAAVCVVQHRGDDEQSGVTARFLRQVTGLAVCEPNDMEPLEQGTVYLAPTGYHMLVDHDHVGLSLDDPVRWARPSVDVLFESAAASWGSGVVGAVLTGANDDGARGAEAIRAAGGVVLVQDPATAERPEMPRAVIARGAADHVLTLEQFGAAIDAIVRRVNANA